MRRPHQDVKVYGIQDRRSHAMATKPWLVRWAVEGRQRARAFRTKAEADRYRALLLVAHRDGEHFDPASGEPESWRPQPVDTRIHDWAQRWLAEQWPEWQPRTRASAVEALARFVPYVVARTAPEPPPGLRDHLYRTLPPGDGEGNEECADWLDRNCLALGQLNREFLATVDAKLGVGDAGQPLAGATAARYRKIARACIRRSVELDILMSDPWPPNQRGRSKRKALRARRAFDIRTLPDPATMLRALEAIPTHQPGSRTYQAMTAVAYYGGLRPSEVVMLRRRALHLPTVGWGRIEVVEADISFDESGEPKTGPRSVPIPPQLVEILRRWVDEHEIGRDELLFRTRNGNRPTASNWTRAWHRSLRQIGHDPLRVYDCRHAAATTWLKAGVPLGEVARRLGHSVETLVSTYVGALEADEDLGNRRIEVELAAG